MHIPIFSQVPKFNEISYDCSKSIISSGSRAKSKKKQSYVDEELRNV